MNGLFAHRRSWLLALVAVVVLAAAMRYVGIGRWSFASDELGTFVETRQFLGHEAMASDDPDRNVPRMIPLAMSLHALGHSLFGSDEAGSRAVPAIFGVLQILLVGIALRGLVGNAPAIAAALLLTLASDHLFYSQYHRFYSPAAFFASASMLATAWALKKQSMCWMIIAVVAVFASILVHVLLGILLAGMVAGIVGVRLINRDSGSMRLLIVALAGCAIAAIFAAIYLYPLGRGKAVDYWWTGASIPQAFFSGVIQVGWPTLLLAAPGFLLLWRRNRVQAAFWAIQAAMWLGALVVLPKVIPFHSAYVFPLNLAIFVLAGVAAGELADAVVSRGRFAASGVLLAIALMNLPALASYYQDGNRHDFRAAANWIADRIGPNDLIVAVQGDKLSQYRPELTGRWLRLPSKDISAWLDERWPKDGRVWIVLPGGRSGMPAPWGEWAQKNARLQTTIVHRRFDYHEYPVFILLEDRRPENE